MAHRCVVLDRDLKNLQVFLFFLEKPLYKCFFKGILLARDSHKPQTVGLKESAEEGIGQLYFKIFIYAVDKNVSVD